MKRLLIANRGEIAIRIIHACRELGIETVAVYSEADRRSPHVSAADHAVSIGPAPAISSYLSVARIIDAVRSSGADAVHPGYGFLSENAEFADACTKAGAAFVGPPADVIARMGSKIEARRLMQSAGVPTVPGETPADQSDQGVMQALLRTGSPALVKASAGGGGKGMREVHGLDDRAAVQASIQAARREAESAFGDGTLYVERLLQRPRHVEVQIVADRHGAVTHLFERECSTQRRHQKVIEESPSPVLTPALRARMTDAAVRAARAADYENAGTIEFLVDGSGDEARFYFLEMNTRLQVEHAVTEAVVGVDLVKAQLAIAAGEPLPWRADALFQRGHAIEARIYAEDPTRGFLPQAGPLLLYREPTMPGIRIDAGVVERGEISVHYDPMIAKVIASAEDRAGAIARLIAALRAFPILGVRTNVSFLLAVLEHPAFQDGGVDTSFLDREADAIVQTLPKEPPAFIQEALNQLSVPSSHLPAPSSQFPAPSLQVQDPWSTLRGARPL